MKNIFRYIALALAVVMMTSALCGCSAFIEGFIEGYNGATQESSTQTTTTTTTANDDEDDEDIDYSNMTNDQLAAAIYASASSDEDDILGKWIDQEDDVINFRANGTCSYYGIPCKSYSFDGEFLHVEYEEPMEYEGEILTEETCPARLYGDILVIFYAPYRYARVSGESGNLYGRWESNDGNDYTFEFYPNGTFTEDDEYRGNFYINGGEMLLLYNNDDYITYGLFSIHESGDQLGFAYGWTLERIN